MPRGARRIPAHSPVKVIPWLMVVAPRLCDALAFRLCPGPRNLQQQEWGGGERQQGYKIRLRSCSERWESTIKIGDTTRTFGIS